MGVWRGGGGCGWSCSLSKRRVWDSKTSDRAGESQELASYANELVGVLRASTERDGIAQVSTGAYAKWRRPCSDEVETSVQASWAGNECSHGLGTVETV